MAVVTDELAGLPRVDDRYRLWPWSLRALAQRRRCSPGTIHKHHQALSAAGVLVTDDHGRTLVDTARLDEDARTRSGPPSTCRNRRRSTSSPNGQRSNNRPPADGEAAVLAAIDALTSALETRPNLAGVVAPMIRRLANLLADLSPVAGDALQHPSTAPQARDQACGARGYHGGESQSDQGRLSSTTGAGARRGARDRAPSKKERKTQDSLVHSARDSDLPGPSFSPSNESRANWGARPGRALDERPGARSAERLLELLGPLDPARHVTYLEGVQAALAGYDDAQVARAVTRIVVLNKATINPVGLLVDRAKTGDPLYFPSPTLEFGETPLAVEPPEGLWSWPPAAIRPERTDDRSGRLPEFDPDPTLAPALAARAALEAARRTADERTQTGPGEPSAGDRAA